jgi:hypothetical protein
MQQENLGQSTSLWMAMAAVAKQSTLAEDIHADVCIVLERRREDLGLPLPRLPLRPPRRSAQRTCEP